MILSCLLLWTVTGHEPTRPLPQPSARPLAEGPSWHVNPVGGNDAGDGSAARPWKTLAHAVGRLRPGDTLLLHGGVYREHIVFAVNGTPEKPITVRAAPGALAVLDGGLAEFLDSPATAWEPCPGGVEGEYRSVKVYRDLGGAAEQTNVLGNFADSMLPLQGYHFLRDLRSSNPFFPAGDKSNDEKDVYCGPGLHYDPATGRIYARLAHTTLKGLGDDNYRGETDPRKLRLIVAGHAGGPVLSVRGRHLRFQDLVVRGAREATVEVSNSGDVEFDGLTVYGGSTCFRVIDSHHVRVVHTACRGLAAPWTFRGSLKYRAIESRLFSCGHSWEPTGADCTDLELAWSEFTDSVDGVFLGPARRVRFHHNLLDNVSDDGIFLTAPTGPDGRTHGGDVQIYQNRLSRNLTTFAFGVGHGRQRVTATGKQTGAGVQVFRNVFDFRRPVMYYWPSGPDQPQEISSHGRVAGDHGGPAWEPLEIYHNTILSAEPPRYDYGAAGLAHGVVGSRRRVFNNLVCQTDGLPGATLPKPECDFQGDGNLFWSVRAGKSVVGDFFAKYRSSKPFTESKKNYPPGWTAHDRFADPAFAGYQADWHAVADLRLTPRSPAVDAGVALPAEWPDPLRSADAGAPDIGALPLNAPIWHVGVRGRLTVLGEETAPKERLFVRAALPAELPPPPAVKTVLVLKGYPAFDASLLEFFARQRGYRVESREPAAFDLRDLDGRALVVFDGGLARARVMPSVLEKEDLSRLRKFVEEGGAVLFTGSGREAFASPGGQALLADWLGTGGREKEPRLGVRKPEHPWVKPLAGREQIAWLEGRAGHPLVASKGENLLGSPGGATVLCRAAVGKGQVVYLGWSPAASRPEGRKPATTEQEAVFEEQTAIVGRVMRDLLP